MFLAYVVLILVLSRAPSSVDAVRVPPFLQRGVNGGTTCAACAVLVGLAEQLTEIYNISVSEALSRFCNFLPSGFREGCEALVDMYGPIVIEMLEMKETPDVVCLAIDLCKEESGEVCHLFPLPHGTKEQLSEKILRAREMAASTRKKLSNFRLAIYCTSRNFNICCRA